MLISLSGLPGAGKTTIACELAHQIRAVHLEIDNLERMIRLGRHPPSDKNAYVEAYRLGQHIAENPLRRGKTVIVDCGNPVAATRDDWRDLARAVKVPLVEVEVVCSDFAERQRRLDIEAQLAIENARRKKQLFKNCGWENPNPRRFQQIKENYHAWNRDRVVINTAQQDVASAVAMLRRAIPRATLRRRWWG